MGRRIPTQVHHQAGRLVRAGLLDQPTWLNAVLMNPPIPLPPKAPPARSAYDQSAATAHEEAASQKLKAPKNAPSKVSYLEDQVRRQFFKDHPFEAFRPDEHPIVGKAWTRLRQHGRNPFPEDAIRFAFRSLRSEHFIACRFAALEKETLSSAYPTSEIKLGYGKDLKQLETWDRKKIEDASEHAARKRWRAIIANYADSATGWSRGEGYTEKWKQGNQPAYNPRMESKPDAPNQQFHARLPSESPTSTPATTSRQLN
ncbi:hypothetical protein BDZ89DRAFT_1060514 [Hymenopellis radicata]|nr:hypothetical protein BDZ89DRAFT_1060514 [Hymenopellis radicata]